jgi:hypothetical protein
MSLQIGGVTYNRLSGPTSFSILKPTLRLQNILNHYSPTIILLGDIHDTKDTICDVNIVNDKDNSTISTYTTLWLRCLDSLGTTELPVRYFVESDFPLEYLNLSYYTMEERKQWIYKNGDKTIMSYPMKQVPECFSTNPKIRESCITPNVYYYFSDLREGSEFSLLHSQHKQDLQKKSIQLAEKIIPRHLITYKIPKHSEKTNKIKSISYGQKKKIYKHTVDSYESILYSTFKHALSMNRSLSNKLNTINGLSVLDCLELLYENPKELAHILFDMTLQTIKETSKVYLSLQNVFNGDTFVDSIGNKKQYLLDLFNDYFVYIMEHDTDIYEYKDIIFKGINRYERDIEDIKLYRSWIKRRAKLKKTVFDSDIDSDTDNSDIESEELLRLKIRKIESRFKKYNEACEMIAITIFIPFNDMFFLFSSWSHYEYSSVSIYHCGEFHSNYLFEFLSIKGIYEGIREPMNDEDEDINSNQCIMFQEIIQADKIITDNIVQSSYIYEDTKIDYINKVSVIKNRVHILGLHLYKEMLQGKLLSSDKYKECCSRLNIHPHDCKHLLNLTETNITVPSEYTSKLRI